MRRWSSLFTTARQFMESRIEALQIARPWTSTLLKPRLVHCECLPRFGIRRTPTWLKSLSERSGCLASHRRWLVVAGVERRRVGAQKHCVAFEEQSRSNYQPATCPLMPLVPALHSPHRIPAMRTVAASRDRCQCAPVAGLAGNGSAPLEIAFQ